MPDKVDKNRRFNQARKKAHKLGLNELGFTLIVCMDRGTAKCCSAHDMSRSWRRLKHRCKQWKKDGNHPILKIKSGCIGVCKCGPIIGVFPPGIWYGDCTPEIVDRIFDEHLVNGNVVSDHVIAGGLLGS